MRHIVRFFLVNLSFLMAAIVVVSAPNSSARAAGESCESLFLPTAGFDERGPQNMAYHLEAADAAEVYRRVRHNLERDSDLRRNRGENVDGKPELSIVIPAYREELRIPRSIEILRAFMAKYPFKYEVIVVAENSPDRTFEVATAASKGAPEITVVANLDGSNRAMRGGKGFAVRTGMYRATGRYKLFMDADLSTSLIEILRFLDTMTDEQTAMKPQVLIGSRTDQANDTEQNRTVMRRLMSHTMHGLTALVGRPSHIVDTQCGFKMFTERAARTLFALQTERGFAFDVELILLARKFDFELATQPVEWIDAPGSTVHPIRDSLKMLKALFRIEHVTNATDRQIQRGK